MKLLGMIVEELFHYGNSLRNGNFWWNAPMIDVVAMVRINDLPHLEGLHYAPNHTDAVTTVD